MRVKELNVGDVFRLAGKNDKQLWRKVSPTHARKADARFRSERRGLSTFTREIEIIERAAEITRSGNTLILKGGAVTLEFHGPWKVHSYTPGDPFTEFVLGGNTFGNSHVKQASEDTALGFMVGLGAKELGRPKGSDIFAYKGRVYARATNKEVRGKNMTGGYKLIRKVDGAPRLIIVGVLTIPGEFALYDIIMEHFGPDTAPKA